MGTLMVDFITSLDGYAVGRGLARLLGARGSGVPRLARTISRNVTTPF